ncbi:MAG TPA: ABC transporter substrate-binding protein [Candidatus Limnocylindrales bacterium]|nr:ABC transporter substrate-binding protein [Candidatus Limnocylindrales bacterium]
MRPSLHGRLARTLAVGGLAVGLLLPAVGTVSAADPVVLRVGTTQDLDSLNPYATILVVGYEAFGLTYNLMVDSGPNLEPVPGFADRWERAADGHSWTFHIRDGMKWSDGQPATSADACFSWQLGVDALNSKPKTSLGAGYLEPTMSDAGVTKVTCPDASTLVATTDDASSRVLQISLPIIPKHIWGKETYKTIGKAKFTPPLVGTGPYTAVEWQTGQFIRLQRNPNYWGTQAYQDEVDIVIYKKADTMVQALKAGELDYAHGPNADQLNQLKTDPNIKTVAGSANGWSQLAFNGYGADTGKTIPNGGPSTKALLDPAFRDALGYAVDKKTLVDRVLGGYGDLGSTIVPPVLNTWHVDPTTPRTFDIALAKQKLDAAGYPLNASGQRLDKQGKPITLRMLMPDSDDNYPKVAQFIATWYGELGVKVSTQVLTSAALGEIIYPPEAGAGYLAKYDIELWGWSGGIDPNGLLQIFECSAIGSSSDSQYCNPAFDQMYKDQLAATTPEARKTILAQMQNLIYDKAVYDILYYDSNLEAYRTDRFAGFTNQPVSNGEPFFTYSTLQYTKLTNAATTVTPGPSEAAASGSAGASGSPGAVGSAAATPSPSGSGSSSTGAGGSMTPLIIAIVALVAIVAVGLGLSRRRSRTSVDLDDE